MKLLSKSEIKKAQHADRALEIAEGLKLSRKVDSLRELKATEEEALTKFRNESLAAITKEINELLLKKESIQKEADALREEMKKETTLSREERLHLERLKELLEKKEKEIQEKESALRLNEIDIATAIQDAHDSLIRATNHEEETTRLHIVASNERMEAQNALVEATAVRENAIKFREDTERELALRESGLARRESDLSIREKNNVDVTRELNAEKIRLADQRATLERELERIKKKRL
jgi:hypothetical protein